MNKQLLLVIYNPGEQNSQGEETITSGHLQHRVNKLIKMTFLGSYRWEIREKGGRSTSTVKSQFSTVGGTCQFVFRLALKSTKLGRKSI